MHATRRFPLTFARRVCRAPRRRLVAVLLLALAAIADGTPSLAVQPDEVLSDPRLEARARHISAGLRCLVCQNQSIDDSNAPLARDLRLLVRERLKAGDSDEAVVHYVVQRYGDFVLLRPPLNAGTVLLWLAPLLLLAGATVFAVRQFRTVGRTAAPDTAIEAPLSDEEKRRLDDILNRDGRSSS